MNKQITIYDIIDCFLNRLINGPDKTSHSQLLRNIYTFMGDEAISDESFNVLSKLAAVSSVIDHGVICSGLTGWM